MQWDYWRLLTVISLSGFIGLLFDEMTLFMCIAAIFYAFWLQRNWFKLLKWLKKPKKNRPPSTDGAIDEICQHIEQMRHQSRSRKKKITGYLKRFQKATAALPDGIVVLGASGKVEWSNQPAQTLLGVNWPRDNGIPIKHLIRDPVFQESFEHLEVQSVTFASPVDNEIQLEIKMVNYLESSRLLIAREITQTIKLQRMRRDFVANVSHELKTPLTVLRGYLETFNESTDASQWQAALPAMRRQSERMHILIKDLLVLSHLESGDKALRRIPTDVSHLLETIVNDARNLEEYQEHCIEIKDGMKRWLVCDMDEVRSAVSNLVFNAIKYTPPGSLIELIWHDDGEGACIAVRDHGEGIAEHHLERLTERFYRVDKSRSDHSAGTGLGLAIVKHVMQRHNGKLIIDSELGSGSCFTCVFPEQAAVEKVTM